MTEEETSTTASKKNRNKNANKAKQSSSSEVSLATMKGLILNALYNKKNVDNVFTSGLIQAEQVTRIKREQLAYGLIAALFAYLALGNAAELLCNVLAFAYPAYASFKAIRTETKEDDTQWLTYWTVFASFSVVDFFSDKILRYFPFYWLLKCSFLIFLHLPAFRGAEWLYDGTVKPIFVQIERVIETNVFNVSMDDEKHHKDEDVTQTADDAFDMR